MWVGQDKDPVFIHAIDQFTLRFISACFYNCRPKKFFTLCWPPATTGISCVLLEILCLIKENVWEFCIILDDLF